MNVRIEVADIPAIGTCAAVMNAATGQLLYVTPRHETEADAIAECEAWCDLSRHNVVERPQ